MTQDPASLLGECRLFQLVAKSTGKGFLFDDDPERQPSSASMEDSRCGRNCCETNLCRILGGEEINETSDQQLPSIRNQFVVTSRRECRAGSMAPICEILFRLKVQAGTREIVGENAEQRTTQNDAGGPIQAHRPDLVSALRQHASSSGASQAASHSLRIRFHATSTGSILKRLNVFAVSTHCGLSRCYAVAVHEVWARFFAALR